MVTMPLWFVDGLSPLLGAFLLSEGFTSSHLHIIASFGAIAALIATLVTLRESLETDIVKKAREGARIPIRGLGRDYWKMAAGMASYIFFWSMSIQYLGNLCVNEWGVDTVIYGMTWSAFSLTSAGLMYFSSKLLRLEKAVMKNKLISSDNSEYTTPVIRLIWSAKISELIPRNANRHMYPISPIDSSPR